MINKQINVSSSTFYLPKIDDPELLFSYAKKFMGRKYYKIQLFILTTIFQPIKTLYFWGKMVGTTGFEPVTDPLKGDCSTS